MIAESQMKESGIDWIGNIPENANITKIKYVFKITCGGTPSTSTEEYWNGNLPWIDSGKIHFKNIEQKSVKKFITKDAAENSSTKLVQSNSTLIALTGATCTNLAITNIDTYINQSIIGLDSNDTILNKILFYYLHYARDYLLSCRSGGAQSGINKEIISNTYIIKFCDKEQKRISDFLDKKTQQIDELVQKTEKKIELLKEQRTALINHCVTKGLNPDAEMKDSGIEWIGEIPEGWLKRKIKHLFSYKKGAMGQKLNASFLGENPGIYPVYSGQTKDGGIMGNWSDHEFDFDDEVIFSSTVGAKSMTTRILSGKFSLSQNCLIMVPKSKSISSKYVNYFLNYDFPIRKHQLPKILQPSLRMEDLDQFDIITPPIEEQKQISDYLDQKTQQIDKLVEKEEKRISLLKEYRQSLISSTVTGKIRVTEDML